MRATLLLVLLAIFALPLMAQDAPVVALQSREWRNDPFRTFNLLGEERFLKSDLDTLEKAEASGTPAEKAQALLHARAAAGCVLMAEKQALEFVAKTKFPPKAAAIMAPVVEYVKSEQHVLARDKLAHDLRTADLQQLRAFDEVYAKVPWLSRSRVNDYINEAYFQGDSTLNPDSAPIRR